MEVEVMGVGEPLMRRARVHSALGEPARLAIVDRLVPGDAAPGELSQEMGIATNLLAHHLRVLEDAGLINRVRSEGDRRRSYVRLRWEDPLVRAAVGPAETDLAAGAGWCSSAPTTRPAPSWRRPRGLG
jgi:DNA-binding transcriptional ArsR family regulator